MKLEYPLNDVLPNIEHARDRLLARLHRFRQDVSISCHTTDEDYALLYAFSEYINRGFWFPEVRLIISCFFSAALVTSQLCKDISAITDEVSRLFGVLDEDVLRSKF